MSHYTGLQRASLHHMFFVMTVMVISFRLHVHLCTYVYTHMIGYAGTCVHMCFVCMYPNEAR